MSRDWGKGMRENLSTYMYVKSNQRSERGLSVYLMKRRFWM